MSDSDNEGRIESLISDPVQWANDQSLAFIEYLFPENEDGSRDAGDRTIITKEAWERATGDWKDRLRQSDRKDQGRKYHDQLVEQFLSFYPNLKSVSINKPRQYGSQRLHSVIDEWAGRLEDTRINVSRIDDPEYIAELKDKIVKGILHERKPYVN